METKEKVKKFWENHKASICCAGGIIIGTGIMLGVRQYEFTCIGRGLTQILTDPAKMEEFKEILMKS